MKKTAKALLLVLCALILVVGSVFGTLAYLTSQDEVVNTFTVGNVTISMDEAVVDEYGVAADTTIRTKDNAETTDKNENGNAYKLIPGRQYTKDPTIHVDSESETCWLFVEITNNIESLEARGATTIAAQLEDNGWTLVDGETNVYKYKDIAQGGNDYVVFNSFKIDGTWNNADLVAYQEGKVIEIKAYAVQSDGLATADAAWAAAKSANNFNP